MMLEKRFQNRPHHRIPIDRGVQMIAEVKLGAHRPIWVEHGRIQVEVGVAARLGERLQLRVPVVDGTAPVGKLGRQHRHEDHAGSGSCSDVGHLGDESGIGIVLAHYVVNPTFDDDCGGSVNHHVGVEPISHVARDVAWDTDVHDPGGKVPVGNDAVANDDDALAIGNGGGSGLGWLLRVSLIAANQGEQQDRNEMSHLASVPLFVGYMSDAVHI